MESIQKDCLLSVLLHKGILNYTFSIWGIDILTYHIPNAHLWKIFSKVFLKRNVISCTSHIKYECHGLVYGLLVPISHLLWLGWSLYNRNCRRNRTFLRISIASVQYNNIYAVHYGLQVRQYTTEI